MILRPDFRAIPLCCALCVLCSLCLLIARASWADEGMWLFNNPPLKALQEKYHFQPTAAWLDHVQKSSVRFDNGGSGSFVSANGLVMTNHHVGSDCLQKMSTKDKNFLITGFQAKSNAEEPKCADLELNVLMSIEDVTARVTGAVQPAMDTRYGGEGPARRDQQHRKGIARQDRTAQRCGHAV